MTTEETDYQTPCQKGNPDHWFIGKDGRQYADEPLVGQAELITAVEDAHLDMHDQEGVEVVLDRLTDSKIRQNLLDRRHAKDDCHVHCYFRNACLKIALDNHEVHGTWGGYFEEELREIRREKARRDRTDKE